MSYINKDFHDEHNTYIGFYEGEVNISKDSDYLEFYFSNHNIDQNIVSKIKEQINSESVSILIQIAVSQDFRGTGKGKEILNQFLLNVQGDCLLICDGNIPEGELKDWYERYGFEVIATEAKSPIMIKRK